MPNIARPSTTDAWPRHLDDLRQNPARLVFTSDLVRLGFVASYTGLNRFKQKAPPLRLPSGRLAWEARAVLAAIGADTSETPEKVAA